MKSIRSHLTWSLTLALGSLLAVCGFTAWNLAVQAMQEEFDHTLEVKSHIIRAGVEEDDGALEMEIKLEAHHGFEAGSGPFFYEVRSSSGEPLLASGSLGDAHLPALAAEHGQEAYFDILLPDGLPARAVTSRFDAGDDKKGLFRNVTLVTAHRSEEFENTVRQLRWLLAATGAVTLALMVPILRHTLRRGLKPLTEMAERTAAIDVNRLDTRLPTATSPEELRPVTETLNSLLERMDASFTRERRFSSDVAHELRTPVAELKSLAELATGWPDQATPEAFAEVLAIAGEMQTVVESLRLLARTEEGTQPVAKNAAALHEIVAEAINRHAATAEKRGVILVSSLQETELVTDAGLWRMIASNLIGNAVSHAPPGSTATVTLTTSALTISNPAPDLAPKDVEQLFERFWRKDKARSGYGHSGLGLALVKSLTTLLGHSLQPQLTGGRLLMTVSLD